MTQGTLNNLYQKNSVVHKFKKVGIFVFNENENNNQNELIVRVTNNKNICRGQSVYPMT